MCSSSHHTLVFCLNYIQWVLWQKVQARRYLRWVTKPLVFQFPHLSSRNKNHTSLISLPDVRFKSWDGWKSGLQTVRFCYRYCINSIADVVLGCAQGRQMKHSSQRTLKRMLVLQWDLSHAAGVGAATRTRYQALELSSAGQSGESTALLSHSQGSTPSSATLPALWCQTSDLTSLRCSFCIFKI